MCDLSNNKPINILSFFYESQYSIPDLLCKDIINLFESQTDGKYEGLTIGGINKQMKDTTDFLIPFHFDKKWSKINSLLQKELNLHLQKYIVQINNDAYLINSNGINIDCRIFTNTTLQVDNFVILKYTKNTGKYHYHNDFHFCDNRYRIITYLWYLNTVEEGGETEFWDGYKIKPEQGKLILFPANWCFHHKGNIPISDNKYIISGWCYVNN